MNAPRRLAAVAALVTLVFVACKGKELTPSDFGHPNVDAAAPMLVAAGEIADCNGGHADLTANLLDTLNGTVVALGDNAFPDGSSAAYTSCYDGSWGRHRFRTRPAAGDAEYRTAGAQGYFDYYGGAAGEPGAGYYSYDVASWHVVVLNSSLDVSDTSSQLRWLTTDLAASRAHCTAAYWYAPRFASGTSHAGNPVLQTVWQTLYNAGVDVVINAQEHNYERFAPQTPTGAADPNFGIREFIVGTGGASLNGFGSPVANSEVRDASSWGGAGPVAHRRRLRLALHPHCRAGRNLQ